MASLSRNFAGSLELARYHRLPSDLVGKLLNLRPVHGRAVKSADFPLEQWMGFSFDFAPSDSIISCSRCSVRSFIASRSEYASFSARNLIFVDPGSVRITEEIVPPVLSLDPFRPDQIPKRRILISSEMHFRPSRDAKNSRERRAEERGEAESLMNHW